MKKLQRKGISTIAATVLFIILIFVLQTGLFLMIYRYNNSMQDSIKTETERTQEKIVLTSLQTDNLTGMIQAIKINNAGAITVRIRAMYIDNQFWCDPSEPSINQNDTFINPKETSWILLPRGKQYNSNSTITAATERGTKSTDSEGRLNAGGGGGSPIEANKFYLGPLMLDFTKFYYARVNSTGGLTSPWRPGWSVDPNTAVAWNITVKDIDDRDITINQFSVLTLWTNDGQSNRLPYYFDPPKNSLTQRIGSNQTVQIIYKWGTPKTNQTIPKTQSTFNVPTSGGSLPCRTFLTFFGLFNELDGTTKPYGQTIPFEAILVQKITVQVSATPNVILINYSNTSAITANLTRGGTPVGGQTVNFYTTAGTLSSQSAITNANGLATVYLNSTGVSSPIDATVTANWNFYSSSTTVHFAVETVQITASPNVIATNSSMKSTIAAVVTVSGKQIAGANVTFTTNATSLSSTWAVTNASGTAWVYLNSAMSPTTAKVTAKWINTLNSTTVRFSNLYITTNKTTYSGNENVTVSGLIRDINGKAISNAFISITVTAPNGTLISSGNSTQTDQNGAFTYNFQLPSNAITGTYRIIAKYQDYAQTNTFGVK